MNRERSFNLADLFEIVAECVPERLAFRCAEHRLSYRELDQRATQLASALRSRGIGRGDNVGIQLANSAAYVESFLACCKIGAAPVNINYRYVSTELAYLFGSLDLKALVYGAAFESEVAGAVQQVPGLRLRIRVAPGSGGAVMVSGASGSPGSPGSSRSSGDSEAPAIDALDYETLLAGGSPQLDDPGRHDNDLYILCTGGTTGRPKGVMWPHKAILMAAFGGGGLYFRRPPIQRPQELAEFVPHGPALVYFAAAPMMHGAAMWATLISLLAGHTVVVNDQPHFDAEHVWNIVEQQGVNILSIVGDAMAQPLIQALEQAPGRWDLSRVITFGNGGAVFSQALQERLKALLPRISISNSLGSSESGLIGGSDRGNHAGGFMQIEPRADLALIDDEGRFVTTPGGEGTLARSGWTPVGYYGDAQKSAETFRPIDGRVWVMTGDRARIDDQGRYVVMGRGSQCINTGGEKVFPEEVEEAVRACPVVHDVLVVGVPDERWGQRVVAVLQLVPGTTWDDAAFQQTCRERLAGYKLPRSVVFAEQIQRSPAGKADYAWAKRVAMEASARA